jgi:Secretion system C-terminal sorting domain
MILTKVSIAQSWQWANSMTDSLNENVGSKITVDKLGNSYCIGYFKSKMIIGGGNSLISNGDYDVYVIKYSDIGQVVWAMNYGGIGDDRGTAICLDSSNNLIITGTMDQNLTFGIQTLLYSNSGSPDFFIVKLNNLGYPVWAKSYVVNLYMYLGGNDICVDSLGNVYVTGTYKGTNINFGNGNYLTSNGSGVDFFVLKLNSNGTAQWVKSGGSYFNAADYGISLALSYDQQNIFVVGDYWGATFIFQGDTIHNADPNNTTDCYLISMSAQSGTKNFLRNISSGGYTNAKGVATDMIGNIYITGNCEGAFFISPATSINDTLPSTFGNIDIYLFKYNENGSFIWSKGIGFTNWGHDVRDVQVDNQNRIIMAGRVEGYIACDTFITSTPGGFLAQFDSLSACLNLISVGTVGLDPGSFVSAAIDKFDNIYVHGYMQYTTTFGTLPFVCNNDYEVFVAKHGFNSLGTSIPNEFAKDNSFSVFPNPASQLVNIIAPFEIGQIQLFDVFGKQILEQNSIHSNKTELNTSNLNNGVYYLSLRSNNGELSWQKIIVCH